MSISAWRKPILHRIARGGSREALMLAFAAAQLGCTAEVASEESTGSVASATNGTINFDDGSCRPFGTTIIETNLQAALTLARRQLDDPLMAGCMENAFLALNRHSFAERFLAEMRSPVKTVVRCEDLLSHTGRAMQVPAQPWPTNLPPGTTEYVEADLGFAAGSSTGDIAAVFLHELAHTKGFIHPNEPQDNSPTLGFTNSPDYQRSVPEQFLACSRNMSAGLAVPNGFRRDLIGPSTTLAPVGGGGGEGYERLCPVGVGTGLLMRASTVIDGVGLKCGFFETQMAGGGNTSILNPNCLSSERLVGVMGSADSNGVTSLGCLCASTTSIQAGTRNESDLRLRGLLGAPNGTSSAFRRWCPAGMVVRGLRGRAGASVNRLEVDCVRLNNVDAVNQQTLAQVGGNGGQSDLHKCAGSSAMTALYFQAGWDVDRLGAECSLIAKSAAGTESIVPGSEHRILVPAEGGLGGKVGREACPAGTALVGMDVWWTSGFAINGVRGYCANVTDWASGIRLPTAMAGVAGRQVASLHHRFCDTGQFITGWTIRSGNLVDAITPICRNF